MATATKIGDITIQRYPSGGVDIFQSNAEEPCDIVSLPRTQLKEVAAELTRLAEKNEAS